MPSLRDIMAAPKESGMESTSNHSSSRKETSQKGGETGPWEQESALTMINGENKPQHGHSLVQASVDGCLQRICLRPNYTLRRQLFLSFGLVSIVSLSFVMITACITAVQAGAKVKEISRSNLDMWAKDKLVLKGRYIADIIDRKLQNYESMLAIIAEATRDRFAGYPAADDTAVPFYDSLTGRNVYPLQGSPMPIDWEVEQFPTDQEDDEEMMQGRTKLYGNTLFSIKSCGARFQGACDPNETDTSAPGYHPLCSDAHNDVSVGGVIQPTETFSTIHRKASDYCTAVLRPLYEYHDDVKGVGIFFVNSGAGMSAQYPASRLDSTQTYVSSGCDWMRQPNPVIPSQSLGTEEEIARCHPAGERVRIREFNPLERPWYGQQAQNPSQMNINGPHEDAYNNGSFILLFTRAVFDRVTKELIGVIAANISAKRFSEAIGHIKITSSSEVALIRWKSGVVIISEDWDPTSGVIKVAELGIGIDEATHLELKQKFEESYQLNYTGSIRSIINVNGKYISSSPVPLPPKVYDPSYEPHFMVITVIPEDDMLAQGIKLEGEVDDRVNCLVRDSLIAGFLGLIVVISVIYVVSLYLTKPLLWMNEIGDQIVNDIGAANIKAVEYEKSRWIRFAPRTEITDLVIQFQCMIKKFSGAGVAKLFKKECTEVRNPFEQQSNFSHLYEARNNEDFKHIYVEDRGGALPIPLTESSENDDVDRFEIIERVHWGHNVHGSVMGDATTFASNLQYSLEETTENQRLMKSRLFGWILCSITVPLLIAMIAISTLVVVQVSRTFPELTNSVEDIYINLEKTALLEFARLRAAFATQVMVAPARDLFVANRITGWLLSGALKRTDSFASFNMEAETCKYSKGFGSCAFYADKNKAVCDCAWDDPWGEECYKYDTDTRNLQLQSFELQNDDSWPNGDRNFTSFPEVATTPITTSFFMDARDMPGSEKGNSSEGHDTAYDRIRVLSAISMITLPLYNYAIGTRLNRNLGSNIALEADGLYGGYAGCFHYLVDAAHFQFTKNNSAIGSDPAICPVGKYGFDPRCRQWYVDTKKVGLRGDDPLHVTSPYLFGGIFKTGQTAAVSIIDSLTGEFIGVNLIDFSTGAIIESLTHEQTPLLDGFYILISPQPDKKGSDTIVAPGFEFGGFGGSETATIADLVLPNGEPMTGEFGTILNDLRVGGSRQREFKRFSNPSEEETIFFAYAPVKVTSLKPVNSSDWSRGVKSYQTHIFSLGLGERGEAVLSTFSSIEEALQRTSIISLVVLSGLILLAFVSVLYLSARVTVSIITPVKQLLFLTTKINLSERNEELPLISGGSNEFSRVHQTFERLHMVVRFANTAFFSGDLTKAYTNLIDALALFTRLENSKAIGVTNNNLGNTMLTIYRTMKKTRAPTMCGLSKAQVIARGVEYFNTTIEIGEKALSRTNEEEGWSTNYLIFMQQLSNRYFNRAMFLLSVIEDHPSPANAERQGFTDLATAKDMDREVIDNGDQQGFTGDIDVHFDLLLGRVKGILLLLEMGYEDEWGVEELLVEASSVLNAALLSPANELFRDLEPAAQMQRLDAAWITFYMTKGHKHVKQAAMIAIRMLSDDEYIVGDAGATALKALLEYVSDATADSLGGEDPSNVRADLFQCRRQIVDAVSLSRHGKDLRAIESMRQSNQGDVSMETF